jgi:hypothetical protein
MYNSQSPSVSELPSSGSLFFSTGIAVFAAALILVTVVLPAEYGIDPTGFGKMTGLKRMGEIKVSLAKEAAAEKAPAPEAVVVEPVAAPAPEPVAVAVTKKAASAAAQTHTMKVSLAPNEGAEIKMKMAKGKAVKYSWWTDGGGVNYDVHGDSKKLQIKYHGYRKGFSTDRVEDTIRAAFDGNHGWFWRNRTKSTVVITLKTFGEYADLKRMK